VKAVVAVDIAVVMLDLAFLVLVFGFRFMLMTFLLLGYLDGNQPTTRRVRQNEKPFSLAQPGHRVVPLLMLGLAVWLMLEADKVHCRTVQFDLQGVVLKGHIQVPDPMHMWTMFTMFVLFVGGSSLCRQGKTHHDRHDETSMNRHRLNLLSIHIVIPGGNTGRYALGKETDRWCTRVVEGSGYETVFGGLLRRQVDRHAVPQGRQLLHAWQAVIQRAQRDTEFAHMTIGMGIQIKMVQKSHCLHQ
jgi:hypothetical protein